MGVMTCVKVSGEQKGDDYLVSYEFASKDGMEVLILKAFKDHGEDDNYAGGDQISFSYRKISMAKAPPAPSQDSETPQNPSAP